MFGEIVSTGTSRRFSSGARVVSWWPFRSWKMIACGVGAFWGNGTLAKAYSTPTTPPMATATTDDSTAGSEKLLFVAAGRHGQVGKRSGSAGVAALEQVALRQVVPVAGGADLDHVAGELLGRTVQVDEAGAGPDAAGLLAQGVAEHVVDVHQAELLADGAGPAGALADVAGRAEQLRVGVADLVAGQPPTAKLQELRLLGEGVVDELHRRDRSGDRDCG